jgi:hypothetical protein
MAQIKTQQSIVIESIHSVLRHFTQKQRANPARPELSIFQSSVELSKLRQ